MIEAASNASVAILLSYLSYLGSSRCSQNAYKKKYQRKQYLEINLTFLLVKTKYRSLTQKDFGVDYYMLLRCASRTLVQSIIFISIDFILILPVSLCYKSFRSYDLTKNS